MSGLSGPDREADSLGGRSADPWGRSGRQNDDSGRPGQADALRKAEEALRASESKYREIFNATSEAIFVHDAETLELLEFNDRVSDLYGFAPEEIRCAAFEDFCAGEPPYTLADAGGLMRRAADEGPQVFEWHARRKGGALFWSEVTLRTMTVGDRACILAVVRDISDRKRDEEEAAKRDECLHRSQRMEAMGRLAGSIAHDFNNILQAIQGYTSLSQARLPVDSPVQGYLQEVCKAARSATDLTRQLLMFSRGDAATRRPVAVGDVVCRFTGLLRRLLGEQVHLEVDLDQDAGTVECDPAQIEQVVMNLCLNARDAMPGGGTIRVTTTSEGPSAEPCREHGFGPEERFAVLSVSDTGTGISPEHLERIFEPFFTTKDPGKGTGLGLATVYGIVKAHGGFVGVETTVGKGTTFRVYLPTTAEPVEPPAGRALDAETGADWHAAGAPGGGGKTILLAEDDELARQVVMEVLTQAGYRVLAAFDGDEAVRLFHESGDLIRLAILDAMMPGRSGLEVCAIIQREAPDIPILISSGYSDTVMADGLPPGVYSIAKPFLPRALLARVRELLAMRAPNPADAPPC